MRIIEITALPNGAHRNQSSAIGAPEGWATIPDDMILPDTFPFVNITVENSAVINMMAGTVPEPEPEPVVIDEVTELKAQVEALSQQNDMLEECIVEMAAAVYA